MERQSPTEHYLGITELHQSRVSDTSIILESYNGRNIQLLLRTEKTTIYISEITYKSQ